MSHLGTTDFALQAARGLVAGISTVNKFGHNGALAATTTEDLWDGPSGTWVAPTTARLHDIVSTSTDDDGAPVGLGARTVRIYGLTGWGTAEVSEDIIMDGTTNVTTSNSYVIIHRMEVLTKGATNVNVGTITATAQTDATVTASIAIGAGQTRMCLYGIPSTQTLYLSLFEASLDVSDVTANVVIVLNVNPEPDNELLNFKQLHRGTVIGGDGATDSSGSTEFTHAFNPYLPIPGPAIVKLSAFASVAASANGGFDGFLVTN